MSVAITTTTQDVYPPRLQVAVTGLTIGDAVQLFRVVGGQRTAVRAGSTAAATDPALVCVDAELPFGVPVSYAAVVNGAVALNVNPGFEVDASDWAAVGTGTTIARSIVRAHEGSASLLITPPGAVATVGAQTAHTGTAAYPVRAGATYTAQAWVYSPTGWSDVRIVIDWYDATGAFLSTGLPTASVIPATTWTLVSNALTAPATAAYAALRVRIAGTPATSNTLFVDEVQMVAPVGTYEYTTSPTTYALPGGKVALSDAISGLSAEVVITAWPDRASTRQATVFPVGGRNIAVLGDLAPPTGTVDVFVETTSALANLAALLAAATSGIVQVRQPGGYDGVDSYLAVLGTTEHRFSQDGTDQRRTVSLDTVTTDPWAPLLAARGFTYADVEAATAGLTYADVEGDYPTYLAAELADWS